MDMPEKICREPLFHDEIQSRMKGQWLLHGDARQDIKGASGCQEEPNIIIRFHRDSKKQNNDKQEEHTPVASRMLDDSHKQFSFAWIPAHSGQDEWILL